MAAGTPTENKSPPQEPANPRTANHSPTAFEDFGLRALHKPLSRVTLCAATLGYLLGDGQWALGIALGALLFALNLRWMDRHFSLLIEQARQRGLAEQGVHEPVPTDLDLVEQTNGVPSPPGEPPSSDTGAGGNDPSGTAISAAQADASPDRGAQKSRGLASGLVLRLPVVALALGGILWYMPARPEGVALGCGTRAHDPRLARSSPTFTRHPLSLSSPPGPKFAGTFPSPS